MTKQWLLDTLAGMDCCRTGRMWVAAQPEDATAQQIWESCNEPAWLLWFAYHRGADRKQLVRCACTIARTVAPLLSDIGREAIETAELWCDDEASFDEVVRASLATEDVAEAAAQAEWKAAAEDRWAADRINKETAAMWAAKAASAAIDTVRFAPSYAQFTTDAVVEARAAAVITGAGLEWTMPQEDAERVTTVRNAERILANKDNAAIVRQYFPTVPL